MTPEASRYKPDPSRFKARTVLWHKQRAVLAQDNFAAMVHLDQLIRQVPADPWAYSRRAEMRIQNADIEGAIQDYSSLINLRDATSADYRTRGRLYAARALWLQSARDFGQTLANSEDWYQYGLSSAIAGDHLSAAHACQEMIGKFLPTQVQEAVEIWNDVFRTALLCVIEPQAVEDWNRIDAAIRPWLAKDSKTISQSALLLHGAIAYRRGDYTTAIQELGLSKLEPASTFLLSGVQLALGNRFESQRLASAADALLKHQKTLPHADVDWYGELVWQLLSDEIRRSTASK